MSDMPVSRVFTNDLLQKEFDRKGYVLLRSLLSAEEVQKLNDLFLQFQKQFEGPFHTSHFSSNVEYKQKVHDTISTLVFPKAGSYLSSYRPLFGNFMVKNPDPTVAMDLHADWTYVDETLFSSAAIWIPLVDVNEQNGCFGLIEGSHKVTNLIRGPLIRQSTRDRDHVWEKRYGKLMPMNAGDALIYNHRLLHYSPANKSKQTRPAINLTTVPQQAPVIHYCMPEGTDEIRVYEVPSSDFYIRYTHFQKPETETLKAILPKDTVKYIDPLMEKFWWLHFLNKWKQ